VLLLLTIITFLDEILFLDEKHSLKETKMQIFSVQTHVNMEKKAKVMAALAASPPSLRGLSSGLATCH